MADSKQAPLDSAAAAKAAFASVQGKPFPDDIFTAPELRWAVIGCGVIANQMAQSLALAGRKLAGVANRTLSKAQAFAEQYGIEKVYETVEDLYADPNIDAVYITTPHNTHITYLRAALAAGKHVLCEKAITLNSAELDEARAIADEHNVVLMDATTVLHMPLYQELRRRMDAGEFGRMNLAQLNFGSYKEYGDLTNRFYNRSLAGGAGVDDDLVAGRRCRTERLPGVEAADSQVARAVALRGDAVVHVHRALEALGGQQLARGIELGLERRAVRVELAARRIWRV